jgi:integrase
MPSVERITKRRVDTAMPPADGELWLWDSDVAGFGLRVRAGGTKVYVLKYGTGRRGLARRVTIGRHGAPWTPDTAREEARRLIGLVSSGKDPAAARAQAKGIPLLEEFSERYLREHAVPHKKPASVAEDRANLRRAILPALGKLRLDTITRADIVRFHLSRKDTPTNANRCLALLSHMFATSEKWALRPDGSNPCRHVERFPENKRKRFLKPDEMARLGTAFVEAQAPAKGTAESPMALAALRLLMLTGARLSEILTLRWEHVDLKHSVLHLPDSKTGDRPVFLNAPARGILEKLPRIEGNPHVIPGKIAGTHLTIGGIEHCWWRVRERAQLSDVRIHDLRHSFASVAVAGGTSLPIIGALLGHSKAETTQRYAHLSNDPLKSAAETVGASIAAALDGDLPDAAEGPKGRRPGQKRRPRR